MDTAPQLIRMGVCVYDLHHPHHNKTLWDNILKLVKKSNPDYFVFGGDNMNMDAVDHWLHDKGDRRHLEGKRLKKEYYDFQNEVLNPLTDILPDYCRKVFLKGNHEDWCEKYIDRTPEVEGFMELEKNIDLKEWEVIDYGKLAKIGKLYFHHGEYVNKYASAKTVDVYNRNVIFGHGHTLQSYTHITPIDAEPHVAIEVPCACEMNPEYMRNRPSHWLNGFGVFYIQENGYFNFYSVVAIKGHFVWEGTYY